LTSQKDFVVTNLKERVVHLIGLIVLLIGNGWLFGAQYQRVIQYTENNRLGKINELRTNAKSIDQVKQENEELTVSILYGFDQKHGTETLQRVKELSPQASLDPQQLSESLDKLKTQYRNKENMLNTDYGFWSNMPSIPILVWGFLGIIFTNISNSIYKTVAKILKESSYFLMSKIG